MHMHLRIVSMSQGSEMDEHTIGHSIYVIKRISPSRIGLGGRLYSHRARHFVVKIIHEFLEFLGRSFSVPYGLI